MIRMKVNLNLDFPATERHIESAVKTGVRQLTREARNQWIAEAGRRLKTTRRVYQDSLQYTIEGPYKGIITLQAKDKKNQWLISALEKGVKGFDLKPPRLEGHSGDHWSKYYLNGKKKERGDPYYSGVPFVDIPFRNKSKQQHKPDEYRRMHKDSQGWWHPGFKPKGTGGPDSMRPAAIDWIKENAEEILLKLIKEKFVRLK